MTAYSLVLYPFFWAYDWDLFSVTAFCNTLLATHLLLHYFERRRVAVYLAIYLLSFSLFFSSLPFILVGSMKEVKEAGPFSLPRVPSDVLLKGTLRKAP
jgi:magnesium-transporting ATPase (P-type)